MSAAPFRRNLTIYQGASFDELFTWKAGKPPTPVDLTGCSALMHVRAQLDSADVLLTLSTAAGGIVLGGTAGTVRLLLTPTATAALTWQRGVYDLEISFGAGSVRRLLRGNVKVDREVTRG